MTASFTDTCLPGYLQYSSAPQATGEFVAYLNLALLANPLIFAVGNLLTPRAAHALAHDGMQAAQRMVLHVSVLFCRADGRVCFRDEYRSVTQLSNLMYGQSFAGSEKVAGLLGLRQFMGHQWNLQQRISCLGTTQMGLRGKLSGLNCYCGIHRRVSAKLDGLRCDAGDFVWQRHGCRHSRLGLHSCERRSEHRPTGYAARQFRSSIRNYRI